jgi:hypothetical protein
MCLDSILLEAIGKTPPLHDGQEKRGLSIARYEMSKVLVHGVFSK